MPGVDRKLTFEPLLRCTIGDREYEDLVETNSMATYARVLEYGWVWSGCFILGHRFWPNLLESKEQDMGAFFLGSRQQFSRPCLSLSHTCATICCWPCLHPSIPARLRRLPSLSLRLHLLPLLLLVLRGDALPLEGRKEREERRGKRGNSFGFSR